MVDRIHGGNIWMYLKNGKTDIIDFSANINPLSLPPKTKKFITRNIDKLTHYPEPESKSLKKTLSLLHNISPGDLLIGNGSIELIYLVPKVLGPKRVLIPVPTFSEYEFAARASGTDLIFTKNTEKNNFKIDISKLVKLIPRIDLLFLCNPNTPTGTLLPREELLLLLKVCKKYKTYLFIDEAFMDFTPDNETLTLVSEAVKNKHVLVLRSLTKSFALAGVRVGYIVGYHGIIKKLARYQYPWNVNSLAQIATEEVIGDKEYMENTRKLILKEREYLFDSLSRIRGIKVYPSDANFLLCKLISSKVKDVVSLSRKFIKKNIVIRDCSNYRGLNDKFFRIAVRKRRENLRLISVLKGIVT